MGIQRHIRSKKSTTINILVDKEFDSLRKVLDSLYSKLHSQGVGCSVKKTEILNDEDEEKLWTAGILNPDTPQGLLNCVFFLNGKNFCLRGGLEHRDLKLSQLQREVVKVKDKHLVRYTYIEHGSKNRSGGLKQLKQENKVVHQYESENINRCHVLILDKYISKLPREAKEKDIFYVKPKAFLLTDHVQPWYTSVPIGRNKLGEMMKTMANKGNLMKKVTNHSLRTYGVTKMFTSKVPEKLIMG